MAYTFAGYEKILPLSESEKQAVTCVMECIELLFIAWFDHEKDVVCARDAYRLYEFIKKQENRIHHVLFPENPENQTSGDSWKKYQSML